MKHLVWLAMAMALSGCGAVDAQMQQSSDACAARGMVLTASGCVGRAGGVFTPAAPPPPMKCTSHSVVSQDGHVTTTNTDTSCHS